MKTIVLKNLFVLPACCHGEGPDGRGTAMASPWELCEGRGFTYPCGVVLRVRVCVCGGAVVLCSSAFGQSECKLEVLMCSLSWLSDVRVYFPDQSHMVSYQNISTAFL